MLARHRAPSAARLRAAPPRSSSRSLARRRAAAAVRGRRRRAAPGDTIWSRQFSTGSKADAFLDVARGPGDVYYCTGIARATEETSTLVLVKYKSDGTKLWSRFYSRRPARARPASPSPSPRTATSSSPAPSASRRPRPPRVATSSCSGTRRTARASGSSRYDGAAHKDDYAADLALDGAGTAFVAGVDARRHHRPGLPGVLAVSARRQP